MYCAVWKYYCHQESRRVGHRHWPCKPVVWGDLIGQWVCGSQETTIHLPQLCWWVTSETGCVSPYALICVLRAWLWFRVSVLPGFQPARGRTVRTWFEGDEPLGSDQDMKCLSLTFPPSVTISRAPSVITESSWSSILYIVGKSSLGWKC